MDGGQGRFRGEGDICTHLEGAETARGREKGGLGWLRCSLTGGAGMVMVVGVLELKALGVGIKAGTSQDCVVWSPAVSPPLPKGIQLGLAPALLD